MLPSRARPRSTNVEVWTPIEGMSSRAGGEPGRIGPSSTCLAPGVGALGAAAGCGATDRPGGAELVSGVVVVVVVAVLVGAGAASAAGGCGGPEGRSPRVSRITARKSSTKEA